MCWSRETGYELSELELEFVLPNIQRTTLKILLSLARIHLAENNHTEFNHYIHLAENTANTISSPEHLGKVYQLKHDRDVRQGDYQSALQNYMLQTQCRIACKACRNPTDI